MFSTFGTAFAGALSAIITAYIAINFDIKKTRNQELIKKRIQIYETVAPMLNDIICHATCVGSWAKIPPNVVLNHKRNLDRQMHLYQPFFSEATLIAYNAFILDCFSTYQGWGVDAKLKFDLKYLKRNWADRWKDEWDDCYAHESETTLRDIIRRDYKILIHKFAIEIGALTEPKFLEKIKKKLKALPKLS